MASCLPEAASEPRPVRSGRPARIVIVDDSLVVRSVIERFIAAADGLEVGASLSNAPQALNTLRSEPADIVILDIEMPHRSGLDALPDLIAVAPGARFLVLSSHCAEGAPATIQALALGACDTLAKPDRNTYSRAFGAVLIDKLTALVEAGRPDMADRLHLVPRPKPMRSDLQCLAIGASTGGIGAIHNFLHALDPRVDAPILITQHLPEPFVPFLVRQLNDLGLRPAHLAEQGMRLARGHVYVAPGDAHLSCEPAGTGARIVLLDHWPNSPYRPSVDPMLLGVARCFGATGAAIMLSGMGQDGLAGAEAIADKGGPIYAQDPDSSVVWGMPGAVAKAGLASAVLPPEAIARFIADCWLETL